MKNSIYTVSDIDLIGFIKIIGYKYILHENNFIKLSSLRKQKLQKIISNGCII